MIPLQLDPKFDLDQSQIANLGKYEFTLKKGKGKGGESLEKAAYEFERFMLGHVYKTMYNSIEKSEFAGHGYAQDIFMGMFIDESVKGGKLGNNGIASMMLKQYSRGPAAHKTDEPLSELELLQSTAANPGLKMKDQVEALALMANQGEAMTSILQELTAMTDKLERKVSSDFGMRTHPIHKSKRFHHGIDYALPHGTELTAPASGTVAFAGKKGGYGNTVIIDHGHGLKTVYAHLSEMRVGEGETVSKNALIGKVGSTGLSTGPHLHFEVRHNDKPLDPKHLVSEEKSPKAL